jgi:hypothetical protein
LGNQSFPRFLAIAGNHWQWAQLQSIKMSLFQKECHTAWPFQTSGHLLVFCPEDADKTQWLIQHLGIEEKEGAERLVRGRWRHMAVQRQVGETCSNFRFSNLSEVPCEFNPPTAHQKPPRPWPVITFLLMKAFILFATTTASCTQELL